MIINFYITNVQMVGSKNMKIFNKIHIFFFGKKLLGRILYLYEYTIICVIIINY